MEKKILLFQNGNYIDFSGRKIRMGDKILVIKEKRAHICLKLLCMKNQVSYEELYQQLYYYREIGEEEKALIKNIICEVRKILRKLDGNIDGKLVIQNIPNEGYRFIQPSNSVWKDKLEREKDFLLSDDIKLNKTGLLSRLDYNFDLQSEAGLPVDLVLFNNDEEALLDVRIIGKVMNGDILIDDSIGFIAPKELYKYRIADIKKKELKFINGKQIQLQSLINKDFFIIKVEQKNRVVICFRF